MKITDYGLWFIELTNGTTLTYTKKPLAGKEYLVFYGITVGRGDLDWGFYCYTEELYKVSLKVSSNKGFPCGLDLFQFFTNYIPSESDFEEIE